LETSVNEASSVVEPQPAIERSGSRPWLSTVLKRWLREPLLHFLLIGIAVFAAQIIKQLGLTNMQTGFTTMIPYAAGTIGMVVWGHYSDMKNERRWNLTASCSCMALGCLLAGLLGASYWSIVGLSLATVGLYASNAHLFPLPAVFLTGPALASGIAWVNSVGILGGSASPPIVGWLKEVTGNFSGGLYALAAFGLLAAIVAAFCVRETPLAVVPQALEATGDD